MPLTDREYMRQPTYDIVVGNSFATRVYGWMTLGLLFTAVVAFAVIHSGVYVALMPYTLFMAFGTLGVAIAINSGLSRFTFKTMATLFLVYSGVQGLFFGTALPFYAAAFGGQVIWSAFLTAGLVYGLAVLFGLFTKTDLTRFARLLQIALFGLIGITVVYAIMEMFTNVSGLTLIISYIGLVIFVALTAVDAQQIRSVSSQIDGNSVLAKKMSIMMALKMYINVIMIFWYLLQILSSSRR